MTIIPFVLNDETYVDILFFSMFNDDIYVDLLFFSIC